MRPVLAAMCAVAFAFAIVLWFGFRVHDRVGAVPDLLFGSIAALAIAGIAGAVYCWIQRIVPWRPRGRSVSYRPSAAWLEGRAQLDRDQAAYDADPNAAASCIHLQPVERAMRAAGVRVKLAGGSPYTPRVEAACRVNEAELRRVFALPAWIEYREMYQPERSERDNPRADIICTKCLHSDRPSIDILTLHPDECRADTPWFPTPP